MARWCNPHVAQAMLLLAHQEHQHGSHYLPLKEARTLVLFVTFSKQDRQLPLRGHRQGKFIKDRKAEKKYRQSHCRILDYPTLVTPVTSTPYYNPSSISRAFAIPY
jgi:hypothetical protein